MTLQWDKYRLRSAGKTDVHFEFLPPAELITAKNEKSVGLTIKVKQLRFFSRNIQNLSLYQKLAWHWIGLKFMNREKDYKYFECSQFMLVKCV